MKGRKLGKTRSIVRGAIVSLGFAAAFPVGAEVTIAQLKELYGSDLEVLGEVQHVDLAHASLVVAGQHVAIAKETTFSYNGIAVADSARALHLIQPGDILAITGEADAAAASISRLKEEYVPGASSVFIRGAVASVVASVGTAKIGDMKLDLTPAMSDAKSSSVEDGQVV